MARQPISITITVTPQVAAIIDELVKTGLFGTTRAAAAERIICRGIVEVLPIIRSAKVDTK